MKSKLWLYSLHFQEELNSSQEFKYTFRKTLINIMDTRWGLFYMVLVINAKCKIRINFFMKNNAILY